jgi:hypothetical protein
VSLPADIIQLVGPGSVPFVVAGFVYGVFELGERLASQRAKDALSRWLVSFDVQKAKALPDGTLGVFEKIFGERHFSLRCFVRSAAFSLGAMVFLGIILLLIYPQEFVSDATADRTWEALAIWLLWSILIDYISLFKTRVILRMLRLVNRGAGGVAIAILIIDYLLYFTLFISGALILNIVMDMKFLDELVEKFFENGILSLVKYVYLEHNYKPIPMMSPHPFADIIFWAGFAPSLWMWLYVFALFVTRLLLRSERIVSMLRWFLDIEKNPFRSIGAVAAALAFIASVAIILVSWEVSRISAPA